MMYAGQDWTPADQADNERYTMDFVNDLQPNDVIVSSTWTLTVAPDSPGSDPTPSLRLVSTAWLTSSTASTQRIAGLLPNVKYIAQATVNTQAGDTLSLWSHIPGTAVG